MGQVITILAIVGLLVFGAYAVTASMDSAAYSWAEGQKAQAYATVAVAQIESDTEIRLRELAMLDSAYTRALAAAFFWPVMAVAGLALAVWVWVQVWLASRRPLPQSFTQPPRPTATPLPSDTWRPALPAPRARDEWDDWDDKPLQYDDRVPERWDYEVYR